MRPEIEAIGRANDVIAAVNALATHLGEVVPRLGQESNARASYAYRLADEARRVLADRAVEFSHGEQAACLNAVAAVEAEAWRTGESSEELRNRVCEVYDDAERRRLGLPAHVTEGDR